MALQLDLAEQNIWQKFITFHNLSAKQQEQFLLYAQALQEANEKFNVTALTSFSDIVEHHFHDSISVIRYIDFSLCKGMADVGTGGGFPGLAVKIMQPDIPLYLIEVNQKKCEFLQELAGQLGLEEVYVIDLDWRTFLRNTDFTIDIFMARASLAVDELLRVFKPSCHYKQAQLIYWASLYWHPAAHDHKYITASYEYSVADKVRKYIVCKGHE